MCNRFSGYIVFIYMLTQDDLATFPLPDNDIALRTKVREPGKNSAEPGKQEGEAQGLRLTSMSRNQS
jgi:hypothetical protein